MRQRTSTSVLVTVNKVCIASSYQHPTYICMYIVTVRPNRALIRSKFLAQRVSPVFV